MKNNKKTGYDVYGDIKEIASCEKQKKSKDGIKVEKIRDGVSINDFISAWGMNFDAGNVIKYVTRAPYKNNKLEDLKKARWYLNKLIEEEEEEKKHEK